MAKYDGLVELLESSGSERVQLGFEQVSAVVEDGLPPSAYERSEWWSNDSVGHVQSRAWLSAGWRVDRADLSTRTVTFVRATSNAAGPATVPGTRRNFGGDVEYELASSDMYRFNTRSGLIHLPDCPHETQVYEVLTREQARERWLAAPDPAEARPRAAGWCETCAAISVTSIVRRGLLLQAVLQALRDADRPVPRSEVLEDLRNRVALTPYELEPAGKNGDPRWETHTTFGTSDMVAAGWMIKSEAGWTITPAGIAALETLDADSISKQAYARWKEAKDARRRAEEFKAPQYAVVDAALASIGEGRWSTCTDLGELAGTAPSAVGRYLLTLPDEDGAFRVLQIDGRVFSDYKWSDGRLGGQREALEAEGVQFDEVGVADPRRHVSREDLREHLDEMGLLPKVPRRAWLVRGNNVNGHDLVPGWLADGVVSLSATNLREVEPGISREELKPIVDEDYAHASYAAKAEKLDEFHGFLTRMEIGHLVVTVDQGVAYVGEITGDPTFARGETEANLRRSVDWAREGFEVGSLPSDLKARLKVQRDVLDLTQQLETLEELSASGQTPAQGPSAEPIVLRDATPELAGELHVDLVWLQECIDLLNDRPQLIFYGPPGTGKTYIAQKLGAHIAGENVRLVQFHPAYSYEDFFEGYRPTESGGFELKPGPMRRIVDQAVQNPSVPHVLIIDEINRGNLAKVFGELYFLLEYRESNVELLYGDGDFSLPPNVYIIGTMNTADRSIALVDAAMRRRFAFKQLHPSEPPTSGVLRSWLKSEGKPERVADLMEELNRRIDDPDFKIGPSYFMRQAVYKDDGLERTWRTSILPLLEEHHYGDLSGAEVAARYGLAAISAHVDRRSAAATELADETGEAEDAPSGAD